MSCTVLWAGTASWVPGHELRGTLVISTLTTLWLKLPASHSSMWMEGSIPQSPFSVIKFFTAKQFISRSLSVWAV